MILRFEIERALIADEIEAEDILTCGAQKMQDHRRGHSGVTRMAVCWDIHWPGHVWLLPSYTLGAMYAANTFATLRQQQPELTRKWQPVTWAASWTGWIPTSGSQASRWDTEVWCSVPRAKCSTWHFERHLRARYLG